MGPDFGKQQNPLCIFKAMIRIRSFYFLIQGLISFYSTFKQFVFGLFLQRTNPAYKKIKKGGTGISLANWVQKIPYLNYNTLVYNSKQCFTYNILVSLFYSILFHKVNDVHLEQFKSISNALAIKIVLQPTVFKVVNYFLGHIFTYFLCVHNHSN